MLARRAFRRLDLFDLAEISPAQKAALIHAAICSNESKKLVPLLDPRVLATICREQYLLRTPSPELESFVLLEYLGLPVGDEQSLSALKECLKVYVAREPSAVASELTALVEMDRESADLRTFDDLLFFQDLYHHHKVALVLWLTDTLDGPRLAERFGDPGSTYIDTARPILGQLRVMTKLRVVREFLDISLTAKPEPNKEEEFARLVIALNTVCQSSGDMFFEKVLERWPEVKVNPLIVRMFKNPG